MTTFTGKSTFKLWVIALLTGLVAVLGYGGVMLKADMAGPMTFTPTGDVSVPADYDGDGTVDTAVWHGATSIWEITRSSDGQRIEKVWGAGYAPYYDVPVTGDYDGDSKADLAVWRRQDGMWYVMKSSDGQYIAKAWGSAYAPYNDVPSQKDYDGDGKTDIAVKRSGDRMIYLIRSSDGQTQSLPIPEEVSPGDGRKASFHSFPGLRAGMASIGNGRWRVEDFALHFVNPSGTDMDVTWKMVADDPTFRFIDGQVGTWTKGMALDARKYHSLNITAAEVYRYVVSPYTMFTGRAEVSACVRGSNPCIPAQFYAYLLPQIPVWEGVEPNTGWFEAWDSWSGQVPGPWDADLGAFIVPYTNYWHNVTNFAKGWHSSLTIRNDSATDATYNVKHVPDDYSGISDSSTSCNLYPFPGIPNQEGQTVPMTVPAGSTRTIDLETLFGWRTDVASYMEGYLVITPVTPGVDTATTVSSLVRPNTSGSPLCSPSNSYSTTLSILTPSTGTTVSGTTPLKARIAVDRGVNVTAIKFYVDGQEVGSGTTSSALAFDSVLDWNSTQVPNGTHRITAKAFRGTIQAGNEAVVDVTVANTQQCAVFCTSSPQCCPGQACVILKNKLIGRCQ